MHVHVCIHNYCFALTVTSIMRCIIMAGQNSCDILDTWYMYSLSLVERTCTYNADITRMCSYNKSQHLLYVVAVCDD